MSEPTIKLPRGADELMREFPATEPDFEAQAQAIQARLKGSPGGMVFDDWLKTPELAAEPGEPGLPSSVRSAKPKSNFAEMARKSVQKKDDSVELAKELLAAAAQNRRPTAEMVERVRAAGRATATSTPLPASERAIDEAQRTSGVVARAATTERPPRATATASANNRGTIIGIAGGLVALAACVALFVRSGGEDSRTRAALAAQKAADAPIAAPAKPELAPPTPNANDGVLSPEALQAAPSSPAAARAEAKSAALKGGTGSAMPAAAPAAKAAPVAEAKPEAVVLEEDPQPAEPAPAPHKPDPAPEPALKPAEGNTAGGSVPLNPSAGALSTALNAVRGGAQACLAGQNDPVTAVVTFASDGHVLRVSAGGPSGACIQAALSKAHVAPFAKDAFSASTTIRPP
jgi:hypothetical protein